MALVPALVLFDRKDKYTVKRLVVTGVLLVATLAGAVISGSQHHANMEANFRQKLQEEYGATSSRSYADIANSLGMHGETSTILTRDGVDTTVFIKSVKAEQKDAQTRKLIFTVVDESSLYPKVETK